MGSSMNGAYDPNVSALPPAMPPYDANNPNALPPNMQNMQSLQNLKDETNLNGAVAKSEQSLQTQSQSEQTDGDAAVTATVPTATTTTTTEIATDATSDVKGEQAQAQNQVLPPAPMAYD